MANVFVPNCDTARAIIRTPQRVFSVSKADDAAAATATAETIVFTAPCKTTIKKVTVTPDAALTANDTNYATITVARRDVADLTTADTVVAATTETTGTGSWVAWTEIDLGTLANTELNPGDVVTFAIAKAGSGVDTPDLVLQVECDDRR